MDTTELKPIVEALIFASDTPLTIDKIKQILETVSKKEIQEVIQDLQAEYDTQNRGFNLKEVASGYQFRTHPSYSQWLKKLKKSKAIRLTQPTLETLAIIAYKQPITRLEIEKIRGVDSDGVIKTLLERKLITIAGRKDIPGKPFIFATTKAFLEVFGLESLSSLPSMQEIEELSTAQLPSLFRDTLSPEEEPDSADYSIMDTGYEQAEGQGAEGRSSDAVQASMTADESSATGTVAVEDSKE
jgi:segregation and condensation protein B